MTTPIVPQKPLNKNQRFHIHDLSTEFSSFEFLLQNNDKMIILIIQLLQALEDIIKVREA